MKDICKNLKVLAKLIEIKFSLKVTQVVIGAPYCVSNEMLDQFNVSVFPHIHHIQINYLEKDATLKS